ncbi:hypothetical protein BSKO_11093 [Bryopsis sp. KO-2023]|nr:hypothetical protein BSKO_11093 [Bryopsis sp. KO-2023]
MAPKKKAAKKAKEGNSSRGEEEAGQLPQITDEMAQKLNTLERLKAIEEKQRNYAQLERNKINDFYEISRLQMQEKNSQLRNKERSMEEVEQNKYMELQVYKQKLKHLLYEHTNHIGEMKAEREKERMILQKEHLCRERSLREHINHLNMERKEREVSHDHCKKQHDKELRKLRQEHQEATQDLLSNARKKMENIRQEMDVQKKRDITEIETRKNQHIKEMLELHDSHYSNMRYYYNDITCNNLDLLKALKEDVLKKKETELHNEKLMLDLIEENRRMAGPLAIALKEKLTHYEKDKTALSRTRSRLEEAEKNFKNMEFEQEVLQQRFDKLEKERDHLQEQLERKVYEIKQKHDLQKQLQQKKVESLNATVEIREAQLSECLLAAQLKPSDINKVNAKLEEVLQSKNDTIQQLELDIAKVSKAHNDLIHVYEAKLLEVGLHPHTLGFRPLITNAASNPAGLVSGM